MTKKTVEQNRSAISGRFVTERYANSHPKTTVTERNPVPRRSSKKGGK